MQPDASLIKKLLMPNDFIGKKLYSVERAKVGSTCVVILTYRDSLCENSFTWSNFNLNEGTRILGLVLEYSIKSLISDQIIKEGLVPI